MFSASTPAGWRVSAGLLTIALLGGALAWWLSASKGQSQRFQSPSAISGAWGLGSSPDVASSAAVIGHVQKGQLANFSLLRTPPEGLPEPVRQILQRPTFGANWKLAQRLPAQDPRPVWIVPGNHFICIIERQSRQAVSTGCVPTKDALKHGVAAIMLRRSPGNPTQYGRVVVGLAPDGTRAVIAHTHEMKARIPVAAGVFMLRDKTFNPPDRLTLVRNGGT